MKEVKPYRRKVYYYETDKMGIVHHSNYIRWMEEARIDTLEQLGIPFEEIERRGIFCPVLEVGAKYRASVHFGDTVFIYTKIEKYSGVCCYMTYKIVGEDGTLYTTGYSNIGFLKEGGGILRMKKEFPDIYEIFASQVEEEVSSFYEKT